ncbi:YrzQ family protein [Bacillus sp. FJAT-29790]|nr:YrzQ family protein [Bacillus sp. FJAT-29790]MBU8879496.1 YrzQ family protein [Bacillus sp. FJAT-29790]
MNRVITSAIVFGAGMAAYNIAQRNNLMSRRNMRKMQKRITKALF